MRLLQQERGPFAHAQLIGGEVTLLPPDDHAAALQAMHDHGRSPMSMTHGDFDYDYLEQLAVDRDGQKRFDRLSFAGHFDMLMFGRRGINRPEDEAALHPYRRRFIEMFDRLQREHGVKHFLAHNMTVTPRNVDQIADVLREVKHYGFGMFSFQPAAFVGDSRRWHDEYRATTGDDIWSEIERGVGARLPYKALQVGDLRCNRTTYGFFSGDRYFPVLDDENAHDLAVRDAFLQRLGGVSFSGTPPLMLLGKLLRVVARHPSVVVVAFGWALRMLRKVGALHVLRNGIRPVTFVMHSFMDAAEVQPAWQAMQDGRLPDDPAVAATVERLQACSYAMAHPETGQLVPACVQHSILDPQENIALRALLPLVTLRSSASDQSPAGLLPADAATT